MSLIFKRRRFIQISPKPVIYWEDIFTFSLSKTKMFVNSLFLFVLLFSSSDIMKACSESVPTWEPQDSGVSVNLRGLSVASPTVAWASGVNGTIVRTTDGGLTWEELPKIKRELSHPILAAFSIQGHALMTSRMFGGGVKHFVTTPMGPY